MRLGAPEALWLLLLLPVLALVQVLGFRARRRALARFGEPRLMASLTRSVSLTRQYIKAGSVVAAVLFIVLALSRPQFGEVQEVLRRQGVDIIFALDTSLSMLAEDVKPNRLVKAKSEIRALLDRLRTDRVGLVTFAGSAFLACPLTSDYGAMQLFLDGVQAGMMPRQGTDLARALTATMDAFGDSERRFQVIVLITDGEDHSEELEDIVKKAAREGIKVFTIGVGTTEGDTVPVVDEDGQRTYRKDREGQVVLSRLGVGTLAKISQETGGSFHQATRGELEIDRVYEEIQQLEKRELHSTEVTRYAEQYQLFLGLAILLLVLEALLSDRRADKEIWGGRFE